MAATPISPKVTAGTSIAAILGLLLSYLQVITPESFAFLGRYQGIAFLIVTLAGGALAAWQKSDPLRAVPPIPSVVVPPVTPVVADPKPVAPSASVKVTPVYEPTLKSTIDGVLTEALPPAVAAPVEAVVYSVLPNSTPDVPALVDPPLLSDPVLTPIPPVGK